MADIWKKWEEHYRNLKIDYNLVTKDGIIDIESFEPNYSILFVLKETNKFAGGSLSGLLKGGPVYQMWHTAARWAYGILNDFPDYESIGSEEELKKALKSIAVVNLKKITGGAYSDMRVINAFANQDKVLLLEQIKSIKPKVIIACGTFEPLIWLLDLDVDVDNPYEKVGKSKIIDSLVVPWRHPSRVDNRKEYERLKAFFVDNDIKVL